MTVAEMIEKLRAYPQTATIVLQGQRELGDRKVVVTDIEGDQEPLKDQCTEVAIWFYYR